jgi:hypothetical protein
MDHAMRTPAIVLGVVLAALAVLGALLAADVRSWPGAITSGDALYAASAPDVSWSPSTELGALARDLLGVQDDVQLREALLRYRRSISIPQRLDNALSVQVARGQAQEALAAAARRSGPEGASQALVLLGILAFEAVSANGASNQTDAAIADFTDAVRADPGNEPAKYDLELLLRLTAAHGVRTGAGQGSGVGGNGRHGGAGGLPGSGY